MQRKYYDSAEKKKGTISRAPHLLVPLSCFCIYMERGVSLYLGRSNLTRLDLKPTTLARFEPAVHWL